MHNPAGWMRRPPSALSDKELGRGPFSDIAKPLGRWKADANYHAVIGRADLTEAFESRLAAFGRDILENRAYILGRHPGSPDNGRLRAARRDPSGSSICSRRSQPPRAVRDPVRPRGSGCPVRAGARMLRDPSIAR